MIFCIFLLFLLFSTTVFCGGYQINPILNENPAILHQVNQMTSIIGGSGVSIRNQFQGRVGPTTGTALSETWSGLPYFRYAYRLNPAWVTGFDLSCPALANVQYPANSFVSPDGIDTILHDYNYSAKISYQMREALTLGVGLDLNQVTDDQVNFSVGSLGKMTNKTQGWSYGWDAGLYADLDDVNALSFTYTSLIHFNHLTGFSQLADVYRGDFSDNLIIPPFFLFSAIQQLNERWRLSESARFTSWSNVQVLQFTNSAIGDRVFKLNYQDTWSAMFMAHAQWVESLGVNMTLEYDMSPQSIINRPIVYPTTRVAVVGGGFDYRLSPQWQIQCQYAFLFANPAIRQFGPLVKNGHVNVQMNMLDFGVVWTL